MKLPENQESLEYAAGILRSGGVAVLPTDTVYGFSGIVEYVNPLFCTDSKIRKIKGREESKPFIQLISDPQDVMKYSEVKIPENLLSYWPGPLTVIVPLKKQFNQNYSTAAFRCPGDKWLRDLIRLCGFPLYSTSVNRSGKPVLDNIPDIQKEFENEVDVIIDAGDKKGGVPSTLVMLENNGYKVIRQGAVVL